jgi:2-methylcitrate synthase
MKTAVAKYSPGLAGVIAAETAVATVGKKGTGLLYRGFDVSDLAANCCFEEVAHLLIYGSLPTQGQLEQYKKKLSSFRALPPVIPKTLEMIPPTAHPMDVLKVGAALMGTVRPESPSFSQFDVFDSLIASFGSMMCYWHHFHTFGKRISTAGEPSDSIAQHYLRLFHQAEPKSEHVETLDKSLILYAEHGLAASTFACRVTISTQADAYSGFVSAIGALRGPLHGGANEAAMELIERFKNPDEAEAGVS